MQTHLQATKNCQVYCYLFMAAILRNHNSKDLDLVRNMPTFTTTHH